MANTKPTVGDTGYSITKGVLNYQGTPFNGEYNGKFYNQGKVQTDAQVKQDFMTKYASQAKLIQAVPELSNLLTQAINQNWSKDQWTTQFSNTQWAQQHPGDAGLARRPSSSVALCAIVCASQLCIADRKPGKRSPVWTRSHTHRLCLR